MRRRRNNKIFLFLVLILFITIGYALLNTTLNINGVAGFKHNTWKIVWDSDSVEVTDGSTSEVVPVVNQEKDTVTYNTELSLPGDFYEFTVDAVNEGTVDGVLSVNALTPVITNEEGEEIDLPEGLIYTIKYADGGNIKKNHLLKAGDREKYRVRLEFDVNAEHTLEEQNIQITTLVPYEQTNKDAIDRDTEKYTITFNPNDGEVDETTKKVVMELPIGELPTPIRAGYSFDGWYTELDGGVKITKDTIPTANTEYFAHWTERVSTFDIGKNVNAKIKKLAGNTMPETRPYTIEDNNITSIVKSDTAPDISLMTSDNIISSEDSEYPIYAWFDQGTIYFWSDNSICYLNEDAEDNFYKLNGVQNIDLNNIKTSKTQNMGYLFSGININAIDSSKLDTSSATSMLAMFSGSTGDNLDLSTWDTSKVTNMLAMFASANFTTLNLDKIKTGSNADLSNMFNGAQIENLEFNSFDTSKVTKMNNMFAGFMNKTIDLSGFNTSNVTDMQYMFVSTKLEDLDLSGFDVSKVNSFSNMFSGSSDLVTLDLSGWSFKENTSLNTFLTYLEKLEYINFTNFDTSNVVSMSAMFGGDKALKTIDLSGFNTSSVTDMSLMFNSCSGLIEVNLSGFDTSNVTNMNSMFSGTTTLEKLNISNFNLSKIDTSGTPFMGYYLNLSGSSLKELNMNNVKFPKSMNLFFTGLSKIEDISFDNVDTSLVTNMYNMFNNCSKLITVDLSGFNTKYVTNMGLMFYECSSLTSVNLDNIDTSNVVDITAMFSGCKNLEKLDLSNFDTSKIKNMYSFLSGCSSLKELNLSNWDFSSSKEASSFNVFGGSSSSFSSLKKIVFDNTILYSNASSIFSGLSNVETISLKNVNTSHVTSMKNMFSNCSSLKTIIVSDDFVVDQVTDSADMFTGDISLVGGNGTVFDSDHIDKEYAHYDGGTSNPGYFNKASVSNKYTITLKDGETVYRTLKIESGESVGNLPSFNKEGYIFDGWYTGVTDGIKIDKTYIPSGDITLYTRYTPIPYKFTITFDANGGSVDPETIEIAKTASIKNLPTPTRNGYDFIGWYINSTDDKKVESTYVPVEDMTLYARWAKVTDITFNSNAGKFDDNKTTNTIIYKHSEHYEEKYSKTANINNDGIASGTYSSNLSTTDVVTIDGAFSLNIEVWYSTQGINYDWLAIYPYGAYPSSYSYNSATISNGKLGGGSYTTKPSDDSNYHKKFTADGNTAQFYFKSNASYNYYGYYAIITPGYMEDGDYKKPERENYIFAGWNTKADGSGTNYSSEIDIAKDFNNLGNNKTLYAQWREPAATFDTGQNVNVKMKQLSGAGTRYLDNDKNVVSIQKSSIEPSLENQTTEHIVSSNDSDLPIYAWFDNGTMYWWSSANDVYLNSDSSYMFNSYSVLTNIDLNSFNTSKVTDMSYMFDQCRSLTNLDLTNFDTSKVTNMSLMFRYCNSLTNLDLTNFDTSKVTNMSGMFVGCSLMELDLSNFNTNNVTDMSSMFAASNIQNLNIKSFNTSNVTTMNHMFWACSLKELDLSNFNTSNVTDMAGMFGGCSPIELDLSKFNTSKVTDMSAMFSDCSLIKLDLSNFNTSNVTDMSSMFSECSSLINLNLNSFDTSKVTHMDYMFQGCRSLTNLDLSNFNTSKVIYISKMFSGCSNLTNLDLGDKFDTSNSIYMSYMFNGCSSLTNLDLGNKFDTSKVTTMYNMFNGCSNLTNLDLGDKFDTSSVTDMSYMFNGCNSLTSLDLGNKFDTSKVTDMDYMFDGCSSLTNLDLGDKFDTSSVTDMSCMFNGCNSLTSLDLENKFDTSKVTDMDYMFQGCSSLPNLDLGDKFDTSSVTDMRGMFSSCSGIVTINLNNFDTSKVTNMRHMFSECSSLTNLNLNSFDTSTVTDMSAMFSECSSLTTLDLSGFDTSSLKFISDYYEVGGMFEKCTNLKTIYVSDKFVTTNVSNSRVVFDGCNNLVGGSGTVYDSNHINDEYARIDNPPDSPGYFTSINNKYKVSFNANGGIVNVMFRVIDPGTNVGTLPTPTRNGYTFDGWYTGVTDGVKIDSTYVPNGNVILYARWVKD